MDKGRDQGTPHRLPAHGRRATACPVARTPARQPGVAPAARCTVARVHGGGVGRAGLRPLIGSARDVVPIRVRRLPGRVHRGTRLGAGRTCSGYRSAADSHRDGGRPPPPSNSPSGTRSIRRRGTLCVHRKGKRERGLTRPGAWILSASETKLALKRPARTQSGSS
jgi:hypothetical protein